MFERVHMLPAATHLEVEVRSLAPSVARSADVAEERTSCHPLADRQLGRPFQVKEHIFGAVRAYHVNTVAWVAATANPRHYAADRRDDDRIPRLGCRDKGRQ